MVQFSPPTPNFIPSTLLVRMFADDARMYLQRAQKSDDEELRRSFSGSADEVLNLAPPHISKIIGETLQNVLVSLGGRRQAGLIKTDIVAGESFPDETEEEIVESLPIAEHHRHQFCQMLLADLKSYLKSGGAIVGSWGSVELTDKWEVALNVTTPAPKRRREPYPRTGRKTLNY
jgi:hypothetical protein